MTWDRYVDDLCNMVNSGYYVLWKTRRLNDNRLLKAIYYGLIMSHIQYAILLWASSLHPKETWKEFSKLRRRQSGACWAWTHLIRVEKHLGLSVCWRSHVCIFTSAYSMLKIRNLWEILMCTAITLGSETLYILSNTTPVCLKRNHLIWVISL